MARVSPIPRIGTERDADFAAAAPDTPARTAWDFESLSWLAPRVPLRQVIYILGAGQDPIKEQFRLLRTRLEDLAQTRPLKTILITSSLPEEGKTLVALNLAAALCQPGRNKVLLLEADLRRPSCCSALGLSPVPGLAECCADHAPAPGVVYRVSGLDLCLLPAGERPTSAIDWLASPRMARVMAEVGSAFDWVLVDSAPLLPVADSVVLSRHCDGILLVVRRDRALKSALPEALNRFEPSKLLGLVLNDFPSRHGCPSYFRSVSEPASRTGFAVADDKEAA
ncbi:MAG TPA: CpsD/CapB family tyrosine-protein kinase [Terriglobales bacterium]|nr:CpsD/CapB family tyrosine-protein kinase [Terriglobales bacterium]